MADLSRYQAQWVSAAEINVENKAFQFRKDITPASVGELAKSMAEDGQKFPVLVWQRHSGEKQLISGFRRVTAAKSLNWEKVLALVIPESDMGEQEALRLNFVENIERKTLTSLDIMYACKKLRDKGELLNDIARLIGKSEAQVRNYLKIANASADVQTSVASGETTIKEASGWKNAPGCVLDGQNDKMYVKSMKSGFRAILQFDRKHDNPDSAIEFANGLIRMIKEQVKLIKTEAKKARKSKALINPESPPAVWREQATNSTASQASAAVEIKHILIEGRSRGKAGDTLELIAAAYDKDSNRIDPSLIDPKWDSSNPGMAEISPASGPVIQVKLKAPGTCFVHARHGALQATAGVEVE